MSEATDQMALFDLLETARGRYPLLGYAFHVPNGEKRDDATAAKLARMGVRRGVPDVILPIRDKLGVFAGLAIELKTARGRTSPEQEEWLIMLHVQGWKTEVCREWTDAARLLLAWVGAEPKEYGL